MRVLFGPKSGSYLAPRGYMYGPIGERVELGQNSSPVAMAQNIAALAPAAHEVEQVPSVPHELEEYVPVPRNGEAVGTPLQEMPVQDPAVFEASVEA